MHHCMHAQAYRAQFTKYMSVLVGTASLDWVAISIVLKTLLSMKTSTHKFSCHMHTSTEVIVHNIYHASGYSGFPGGF